jgi:hypothetical protein
MYVDQSVGWGLGPEFEWAFGYLITTLWVTGRAGQHSPALLGRTGPEEGEREVCEKSGHKHTASFVLVLVPLIYRWKVFPNCLMDNVLQMTRQSLVKMSH